MKNKYKDVLKTMLVLFLVGAMAFLGACSGSSGVDEIDYTEDAPEHLAFTSTRFRSLRVDHDFEVGGDVTLEGDFVVADTLDVNGDIDLDGDGFDVDVTGGASIDADLASNYNTSVGDLTLEAETGSVTIKGDEGAGDAISLDANDAVTSGVTIAVGSVGGLNIGGGLTDIGGGTGGTADGDNDLLVAADVEVDGVLRVDGSADLNGTGVDADVTAAISLDADTAGNFNTAAGDLTFEAETGSVTIKGDEGAGDAILLDANDAVTSGLDIDVGSVSGMTIDGGLTNIGGGTCATALGDNDLCVAGDIEVDGTIVLANTNFPIGFATSGQQLVYGTSSITGTEAVAHGLTTVTFCLAVLGEDPKTGGGEAAFVTVAVSGTVCTAKVWQDDWTTAATETGVVVQWFVIGAP